MGRIGQNQLELAIAQDVPHGLPIDPGSLHRHMRTSALRQPGQQSLKPRRGGIEGPAVARDLPASNNAHTGDGRLLMNIETGNTLVHYFHRFSLSCRQRGGPHRKRILRNLLQEHCGSLAPLGVFEAPRTQLPYGLPRTIKETASLPAASNILSNAPNQPNQFQSWGSAAPAGAELPWGEGQDVRKRSSSRDQASGI